jgi:hypothetical protein
MTTAKRPRPANRRTEPRMIEARMREDQAISLRLAGLTLQQIADQLGFADHTAAIKAIDRALARAAPPDDVDQLRQVEAARLDRLIAARWQAALQGDDKAVASVVQLIARRCRLLGLDRPVQLEAKVEHVEVTPIDVELALLAAQLGVDPQAVAGD